jgi:hypothetical protein
MKKFYLFLIALISIVSVNAQCTIDTVFLASEEAGMYPTADHLPHAVRDSLYDQTVQGKIPANISMNFFGIIDVSVRVDSVRLDSILGLPNGISWTKSSEYLLGGGYGCVQFTGTTSDSAGVYQTEAIGQIWAHLSVPLLGIDVDTFSYGSLQQFPAFNNFFIVVDSVQTPLSATIEGANLCFGDTSGSATVFAAGGSPVTPYLYTWSTGGFTYTEDGLTSGTYSVTVTSGSETATASVTLSQQPTSLELTTVADSSLSGSDGSASVIVIGGVPPYQYFWDNGDTSSSISGLAPGTYTVTVVDSFGCVSEADAEVFGAPQPNGITSLADRIAKFSLFPNPANSVINVMIESRNNISTRIEAVDMTGRVLYSSQANITGRFNQEINLSSFSAGVYTLQLVSEKQSMRQRFVVTH